ncbi:hypothetical protein BRADI_2g04292v3 [Brachypodium distachyon]|uniref:Uncharacterized protein n=1 Tax=Brachypodium distachyon TaxID=15368 RepID=A0A2K2D6W5_BRADI|nr:hypothetical protein BRADI_2g04292v3 [Brachypodium distachyon]
MCGTNPYLQNEGITCFRWERVGPSEKSDHPLSSQPTRSRPSPREEVFGGREIPSSSPLAGSGCARWGAERLWAAGKAARDEERRPATGSDRGRSSC